MNKVLIEVANKTYEVSVAKTDAEKEKGLMGVETLPENQGVLFDYSDDPQKELQFWMKDTLIPLDIIFINQDNKVAAISEGVPLSEEQIICEADENEVLCYVLEVNKNSGIKVNDLVQFIDQSIEKEVEQLYILDPNGNKIALIESGSRIFSRKNTRVLIKLAKQAQSSKSEKDYEKVGKTIFKFLDIQDSNDAEYVDAPIKQNTDE